MKPLIVANWKMHKTLLESVAYVQTVGEALHQLPAVEVVLCPPFIALPLLEGLLKETRVKLGAQNVAMWTDGAYTGEVSATMLQGLCDYCIIGHSERRRLLGETPEQVNEKLARLQEVGIQPIVCVSQQEELAALVAVKSLFSDWIVAYEPLTAIGSDHPEEPELVAKMVAHIRKTMVKQTRVLYGGSTNEQNVRAYLKVSDGVLVGGASLDPQRFLAMCEAAQG